MQADLGLDDAAAAAHAGLFSASMPSHEWFQQSSGTCGSLWDECWADTLGPLALARGPSDELGEVSASVWHSDQLSASGRVGSLYGDRGPNCNVKMEDGYLTSNRITDEILDICDMYRNGPSPPASDTVTLRSESSVQEETHFSGAESAMRLDCGIDVSTVTDVGLSFLDGLCDFESSCTGGGFQVFGEFVFGDAFSPGVGTIEVQSNNPIHQQSCDKPVNGGGQATTESLELAVTVTKVGDASSPASGNCGGEPQLEGTVDLARDAIVPNASPSRLEPGEVVKAGTSEQSSTGCRNEGGGRVVRSRKRQKDSAKDNQGLLITLAARNEYLKAKAEHLAGEVAAAKRRLIDSIVGPIERCHE